MGCVWFTPAVSRGSHEVKRPCAVCEHVSVAAEFTSRLRAQHLTIAPQNTIGSQLFGSSIGSSIANASVSRIAQARLLFSCV